MTDQTDAQICGIVMPISAIDDCTEQHWQEVREILSDAIEEAGFLPQLVSDANEVGIIQKRIIQNLYENPMVICDVSAKNPNVMFELGMRLAFDRPTIIVKDDKTSYSFDTAPVEHLLYPRDLRFSKIVEFKESLVEKIRATNERAITDKNYTTFLKHFGTFKVAELKTEVVPQEELVIEEIRNLRSLILATRPVTVETPKLSPAKHKTLCLGSDGGATDGILSEISDAGIRSPSLHKVAGNGHIHLLFRPPLNNADSDLVLGIALTHAPKAHWLRRSGSMVALH
jgi:hypothetical protein